METEEQSRKEGEPRLKFLLRQERRKNPVIWASIVLSKEILLSKPITAAKMEIVLPSDKFDGTKRKYAVNRAREIAELYRANKEKYGEDLDLGVKRAENELYWMRDVMDEIYASFRRDGEEYGIAKQKLAQWLKEERRKDPSVPIGKKIENILKGKNFILFFILSIFLLIGSIVDPSDLFDGYYMLLRLLASGVCLYSAVKFKTEWARWIFGGLAVLYNPVLPVHLGDKEIWSFVNYATIIYIWIALRSEKKSNEQVY